MKYLKKWKVCVGLLAVGSVAAASIYGYNQFHEYMYTAETGELTNEDTWNKILYEMPENIEDIRVTYAQKTETDIQVVSENIGEGVMKAGTIETFDLSFMKEDEENSSNNSNSSTNSNSSSSSNYTYNYSYNSNSSSSSSNSGSSSSSSTVSRVPQTPTTTYSAPAGQWCTYQGSANIRAFTASDFASSVQSTCKTIYDSVVSGKTGSGIFKSASELNEAASVFSNLYSVRMIGKATNTKGEYTGYFEGLSSSRINSASSAEKVVKQLFPNGATANAVVQGCAKWIANHTSYSAGVSSSDSLFSSGVGNCNAYASAFKQMCNAMGLQCDIVAGTAYNGSGWIGHAWNIVYISGVGYYVDVCFADTGANWAYILSPTLWSDHSTGVVNNGYLNS